jgi:hypothetical protein
MEKDLSLGRFNLPKNILVVGSTQSGKTEFVKKLLLQSEKVFTPKVCKIIYCYGAWQPAFEILESELGGLIQFRSDIPTRDELMTLWRELKGEIILVLDDKMVSLADNARGAGVVETVCVLSQHCHISCVITLQNIFHNKTVREISLNSHYICLFRNARSAAQVRTLGNQIMPGRADYFMDSYSKAVSKNFGYLLLDLSPTTPDNYRLRTNIFPGEDLTVFTQKK